MDPKTAVPDLREPPVDSSSPDQAYDIDALLHPARVFARPGDVVSHPTLSLAEKRAILASWASDACAVEAAPALRQIPGAGRLVRFDEVMDALRTLDRIDQPGTTHEPGGRRRRLRVWRRDRGSDSGTGAPLM